MYLRPLSTVIAFGVASLSLLASSSKAQAALLWNWSYSGTEAVTGTPVIASGTWQSDGTTYDPSGSTIYTINSISGTRNGVAITGLSDFDYSDNTFSWDGTHIIPDYAGIAYNVASGSSTQFNLFSDVNKYANPSYGIANGEANQGNLTPSGNTNVSLLSPSTTSVPEPSAVLGTLALGCIGLAYKFKRPSLIKSR